MTRTNWIILCLAYIVGLLSINLIDTTVAGFTSQLWWLLAGLACLACIGAIATKFIRLQPQISLGVWFGAGIVAILAVGYFQLRIPQPQTNDISYQITASSSEMVTVTSKVLTEPRLNDSQRLKFWLATTAIRQQGRNQEVVSGKLYATLPLLQGTGIHPGQKLDLTGLLYLPQAAENLGGFDFKQYLARQGIFAGIQGIEVRLIEQSEPRFAWWKLRRRIVRSQLQGLGSPFGQLVSSMVLGRKAVDLPSNIRDRFITAGLAHVLAASGFHVSLLLGIMLKITERVAPKPRFVIGIGTLIVYLGLTGIQASVLRACLMGTAILVSLTRETKVKPLGSLLLVATVMLLFDPLLIGDLGFQLSFLATFGLIATLPELQAKLDWLPPAISAIVAVPLAATIWVLPLLAYQFNTLATYSIVVNIVCTPLITIISLGGMVSAIAALIVPVFGSGIASLLFYPTRLLVEVINLFTSLPGSVWAIGSISLGIVLSIYGLWFLVWLNSWFKQRWWIVLMLVSAMVVTQLISNATPLQITVLAARQSQIMVIEDRRATILINSGAKNQAKYIVVPFLARQGINQIDYGLALDAKSNAEAEWYEIYRRATVLYFDSVVDSIPLLATHRTATGKLQNKVSDSLHISIDKNLKVINIRINQLTWLIIGNASATDSEITRYIKQHNLELEHPVIVWSGNQLASAWLKLLQPQMAIASSSKIDHNTREILSQNQIELHNTALDGMIRWTSQDEFMINQGTFY